jgi:hypothetical protein
MWLCVSCVCVCVCVSVCVCVCVCFCVKAGGSVRMRSSMRMEDAAGGRAGRASGRSTTRRRLGTPTARTFALAHFFPSFIFRPLFFLDLSFPLFSSSYRTPSCISFFWFKHKPDRLLLLGGGLVPLQLSSYLTSFSPFPLLPSFVSLQEKCGFLTST